MFLHNVVLDYEDERYVNAVEEAMRELFHRPAEFNNVIGDALYADHDDDHLNRMREHLWEVQRWMTALDDQAATVGVSNKVGVAGMYEHHIREFGILMAHTALGWMADYAQEVVNRRGLPPEPPHVPDNDYRYDDEGNRL